MLIYFINTVGIAEHSSVLDYLNPLRYVSQDQYILLWSHLFSTILQGFWAKLIASCALFLAFFFGVYRQRLVMGIVFYCIAIGIAYGGFIIQSIFSLSGAR